MIAMYPKLAMLAKAGDPDSIEGAVMEPKLDGHRVLAFIDSDGVRLYARTGVDKTAKLPRIAAALQRLPVGTILDGEVIAWNRTGGDWSSVQSVLGADDGRSDEALVYVVFDALALAGEDVMLNPLHVRRAYLEMLFPEDGEFGTGEPLELIEQVPYDAERVASLIAQGWEGVIVKSIHGTYQPGKRGWIKVKATHTEDVVVMGATEGKGRFAGQIGALVFGQYVMEDDHVCTLVEKGQCSGMDDEMRLMLSGLAQSDLVGSVIEVQHMGKMPSGGWRHPQFKRFRTDKLATDCVAS